jgi:hypothetical protein
VRLANRLCVAAVLVGVAYFLSVWVNSKTAQTTSEETLRMQRVLNSLYLEGKLPPGMSIFARSLGEFQDANDTYGKPQRIIKIEIHAKGITDFGGASLRVQRRMRNHERGMELE